MRRFSKHTRVHASHGVGPVPAAASEPGPIHRSMAWLAASLALMAATVVSAGTPASTPASSPEAALAEAADASASANQATESSAQAPRLSAGANEAVIAASQASAAATTVAGGDGAEAAVTVASGATEGGRAAATNGAEASTDDVDAMRQKVDMLARKVGELQARLLQLDMLGDQLADLAGVPEESYRIEAPDAQGGPMIEVEPMSFEQLEAEVLSLEQRLAARADHLAVLDFRLSDLVASHQLTPSRMPIEGYRYRSSSFGPRFDPINRRRAFHEGIDFAAPRGTPIYAAAGGVVLTAKYLRGYGNTVEIDHGDRLVTRYAHASRLLVKPGQVIKRGQQVATVGSTGRSTGPHLHFEVRVDGQAADPRLYLAGAANPLSQALARAD